MSVTFAATSQPPSYDLVSEAPPFSSNDINDLVATDPIPDLPVYTTGQRPRVEPTHGSVAPQSPKEFYYELKKRGKSFAILTIIADGKYSKHMPTFVEGTPIKGRVSLILDKPDAIHSVVVNVLGQFITGVGQVEQLSFIDIPLILWSQADGEPRQASSDEDESTPVSGSPKFTGKLHGKYTWKFCVDIPREVVMPTGPRKEPQVFHLPQTFQERHTRATISYEICLKLMRNKLRADHRIPAQFAYVPITRPGPFSPLRRLAYAQGTPLVGPNGDSYGWHASDVVNVDGTAFNTHPLRMTCQMFLAKPLSYTRGSVIPMYLRIESEDQQALDLVSSPKAIVSRLRRRIKYHRKSEKTLESLSWKDAIDHSQLAVWWPSMEGEATNERRTVRYVNGELHLRSDVKPSSAMASFRVEYSMILFPFDAAGIDIAGSSSDALIEVPVEIVTAYAPGPRPRMLAPPSYESDAPARPVTDGFVLNHQSTFF